MSILTQTLIISGIGIGLIFLGIICLWIMMELLVRFVHDPREAKPEEGEQGAEEVESSAPVSDARRKAALVAVAVALARKSSNFGNSAYAGSQISNWQSARRAMDRQHNTQLFIRKR